MADEKLNIEVRLKDFATSQFSKLNSAVKGFGGGALSAFKSVTGAVFSLKGALAGLGLALTAKGLSDLVTATADEADELRDLSIRLGTTTEFLSEIKFAAGQAGVEFGKLETGLGTLGKNLGEIASTGGGRALKALELFDEKTQDVLKSSASLSEKFLVTARAIRALPESARLFATSKLFGDQSILQLFSEDLDEATEKARKFGLSISKEAADGADAFNDALGELKGAFLGLRNEVILPLLPEFTKLTQGLTEGLVEKRPEILRFFAALIEGAGGFAEGFAEVGASIKNTFGTIDLLLKRGELLKNKLDITADPQKVREENRKLRQEIELLAKASETAGEGIRSVGKAAADSAQAAASKIRAIADGRESLEERLAKASSARTISAPERERIRKIIADTGAAEDRARAAFVKGYQERGAELVAFGKKALGVFNPYIELVKDATTAEEDLTDAATEGSQKRSDLNELELEQLAEIRAQRDREAQSILAQREASIGAAEAFRQLRLDSEKFGLAASEAIFGVADSLSNNLTDGLVAVAQGTKSAKDAFADFAKGTLNDIQRIIIQTLVLKAVQSSLGGVGGALFAQGGILPGSVRPVGKLAKGDVIQPPGGVFEIAEAGRPEAVLPLVRNQRGDLGVQTVGSSGGGGAQPISVTVNYNGTIGEKALFARNAEQIRQAVAQGVRQSAQYRESIRTAA